jgi:hypothetical protein
MMYFEIQDLLNQRQFRIKECGVEMQQQCGQENNEI